MQESSEHDDLADPNNDPLFELSSSRRGPRGRGCRRRVGGRGRGEEKEAERPNAAEVGKELKVEEEGRGRGRGRSNLVQEAGQEQQLVNHEQQLQGMYTKMNYTVSNSK